MSCMESGDWRSVLGHFDGEDKYHEPLLVWIRPDLDTLHFIRDRLADLGVSHIVSVGSGCAFLEWLISKACSPQISAVHCLEVNATWWESPHSTPHYMPLEYNEDSSCNQLPAKFRSSSSRGGTALMFCYFNNIDVFKDYLASYEGNVVVLIGPVGNTRHCDPEPMFLRSAQEGVRDKWYLTAVHDVRAEGEDAVAIYQKV